MVFWLSELLFTNASMIHIVEVRLICLNNAIGTCMPRITVYKIYTVLIQGNVIAIFCNRQNIIFIFSIH